MRVALLLLALTGCGSLYTEIDEPSVCQTVSNQRVLAAPADAGMRTITVPIGINLRKELGSNAGTDGSVQFTSFALTAESGITDFGFLQSANVNLLINGGDGGFVPLAAYQAGSGESAASPLNLTGNQGNVYTYVKAGVASLSIQLTGVPPDVAWTFDAEACAHIAADL